MNRLSILFVSVLAGTIVVTATAQQTGVPEAPIGVHTEQVNIPIVKADFPARPDIRDWQTLIQHKPQGKLTLITVSQPGVRHTCRIASISEKDLVCRSKLGHNTTYASSDVAALLNPTHRLGAWLPPIVFFSLGGGAIAGAYFVAAVTPVGAVALGTFGVLALFISLMAAAFSNDDGGETICYLRAGTELSVKLRN